MNKLKLKYLIENEQLLRELLLENNISRKTLTRIKFDNDGSIKVNGKEENVRYTLKKNDVAKKYFTTIEEKYQDYDGGASDAYIEMVKYF